MHKVVGVIVEGAGSPETAKQAASEVLVDTIDSYHIGDWCTIGGRWETWLSTFGKLETDDQTVVSFEQNPGVFINAVGALHSYEVDEIREIADRLTVVEIAGQLRDHLDGLSTELEDSNVYDTFRALEYVMGRINGSTRVIVFSADGDVCAYRPAVNLDRQGTYLVIGDVHY